MDFKTVVTSAVTAAFISGIFALITALLAHRSARNLGLREKAWTDYELRRDRYFRIAELISCLFQGGNANDRAEFHKAVRTIRLVGSDEVVTSLNRLTESIKANMSAGEREQRYRALFNAMRSDIRRIHELPPRGTDLGPDAFPIEN